MKNLKQDFANTVTFITGASSGIGSAVARELVARGGQVALVARRVDRLEKLANELGNNAAIAIAGDVTCDGDMERAVSETLKKFGKLDIVIANAGFGVSGKLAALTIEDYRKQFETNVFGVLRTIYASLPELKKSRGRLVLLGSVAGHIGMPGVSAYSMSKFSVRALAESITEELRPDGISVTLISPGCVTSEIRHVDNAGKLHVDSKDPVPAWLSAPAEVAARELVNAIAKRKRERILTFHGKLAWFLDRHFPCLTHFAMRLALRK